MLKITIIGAGHGGLALAAYFSNLHNQVTLCADNNHLGFTKQVKKNNNTINIIDHVNNKKYNSKIFSVTNSYKTALSNSEIIFIATPSYAHQHIFNKLVSYIQAHHKIITLAGNFSTIVFNNILQISQNHAKCTIADISSLPYACRVNNTGYTVDIFGIKKQMGIAAIPAKRTAELANQLSPVFPTKLVTYQNPLEIGLNITSGISHPIAALFNAGRIGQNKDEFYFYKDGISEHTSVLLEQLDADRRYIGSLYNLNLPSYLNLMSEFYGNDYSSIHEFFTKTPIHNAQKLCPSSLSDRYISQDVPFVIVPWYVLGKLKGFESIIMRNIIEIASLINKTDYLEIGLNQQKLMSSHTCVNSFIKNIENGCLDCFPAAA
ncbi:MAG: NAD/NADP octopine/nopaline dehydrogenase family protein [Gammaproteobacteria bacterium]|nr:NAD/NADP octopine/nopaline dehydrogenase family protein [Gammaproteobacteria bacterium]